MDTLSQNLYQKYQGKKILILGFAREGKSTYALLRRVFPDDQLGISDQKPLSDDDQKNVANIVVEPYLEHLESYDVIFKTPGISVQEPALAKFVAQQKILTSQLNEFLEVYKKQTIGVTGTKGKSTTSSLIYHILQTAKVNSILAGNIGLPVFDYVQEIQPETQVVVEMSSYQLETVHHSPHIAVLLNIFPEHLNYHGTLEKYLEAKSHITLFQAVSDIFIYNQDVPEIAAIARKTKAQTRGFSVKEETQLEISPLEIALYDNLSPIIRKNNVPPAVLAAEVCCVKKEDVKEALHTFHTLPHRLEVVGTYNGVTFIDDTLATIPEATCAALENLENISVIILGGFDRGIEYDKVVDAVMKKKIPTVLFFKPSGEKMFNIMKHKYPSESLPNTFFVETMEETVRLAYEHAPQGSKVLLSPASPSFGTFKDYEDKSAQFVEWMEKLGSGKS